MQNIDLVREMNETYSLNEAKKLLRLSVKTIRKLINEEQIDYIVVKKRFRITAESINKILEIRDTRRNGRPSYNYDKISLCDGCCKMKKLIKFKGNFLCRECMCPEIKVGEINPYRTSNLGRRCYNG